MADLSALIRLHKYELDEKRRALSVLYTELAELERERQRIETELAVETASLEMHQGISYTYASYAERMKDAREAVEAAQLQLELRIQVAKDSMMETFGELKKFEMTQAERERLEEEERAFKESAMLDEIGLETYRRRQAEDAASGKK